MERERAKSLADRYPQARVAGCSDGRSEIWDATVDERFGQWLLQLVGSNMSVSSALGSWRGSAGHHFATMRGEGELPHNASPESRAIPRCASATASS